MSCKSLKSVSTPLSLSLRSLASRIKKFKLSIVMDRPRPTLTLLRLSWSLTTFLKFYLLRILNSAKDCPPPWPRWSLLSKWEKKGLSTTLCLLLLMKLVSTYAASLWKSRSSVNGESVKTISSVYRTKDLTYSNPLLSSVRRRLKRNTLRELKKSVLERPRTKSVLLPKFSARESRS